MTIADLLDSAQFVVDAEGNKKAVLLDFTVWQEFVAWVEELEDLTDTAAAAAAYEEYKQDPTTARPWTEVEAEMAAEGLLDD